MCCTETPIRIVLDGAIFGSCERFSLASVPQESQNRNRTGRHPQPFSHDGVKCIWIVISSGAFEQNCFQVLSKV